MNLNFHSPVIITNRFEDMLKFYKNILGMSIKHDFGNCITFNGGLSIWQLEDNYPIAQHLGRTYDQSGNKNLELCFETESIDEFIESINDQKIHKLHEVTEERWGQKTIRFFDPDKNLIEVGESLKCLVIRLKKEGKSIDAIEHKTSLPKDLINELLA
jgi:catechol 2,3-dioxygenase-like lactoylglutathione lyase family enzyme